MLTGGLGLGGSAVDLLASRVDRSGQDWSGDVGRASKEINLRRWERVPLSVPVTIRLVDGRERIGRTLDCSAGGVGLVVGSPIDVGTRVRLRLDLEDSCLHLGAIVRRCTMTSDGFVTGCELVDLQPWERQQLAELVHLQERRQSIRVQVETPVEYRILAPGTQFESTVTTDISAGGIQIVRVTPAAVGDRVELKVILCGKRFSRVGTIVRLAESDGIATAAVCFDPNTPAETNELAVAIQCCTNAANSRRAMQQKASWLRLA